MRDACVARQPIFDRRLNVVGYELLFRDPPAVVANVIDHAAATTSVILNTLTEIGLQRVVDGRLAWINASRDFLLGGLVTTLPPARVALEILEGEVIDDALVETVGSLVGQGYRFALDDFAFREDAIPLLGLVEVVKLDLMALGRDGMAQHVELLAPYGVDLLAEKVETPEEHEYCMSLGIERFQGYFYRRPELLTGKRIEGSRVSLMRLLAALQDPALDLHEIERLIGHDVGVSARLLRYINSAYLGLRHEVGSIGQAVALLGAANLRRWATLSLFAGMNDKPSELTRTALVRARFCELVGMEGRFATDDVSQLFTLGLFSVIDALMDAPIDEAIRPIPFPADMRAALVDRDGPMGALLQAAVVLEEGAFERADELVSGSAGLYIEALAWADEAARQLFEQSAAVAA
jgi:c-di-GMP phosphodiesterase